MTVSVMWVVLKSGEYITFGVYEKFNLAMLDLGQLNQGRMPFAFSEVHLTTCMDLNTIH